MSSIIEDLVIKIRKHCADFFTVRLTLLFSAYLKQLSPLFFYTHDTSKCFVRFELGIVV